MKGKTVSGILLILLIFSLVPAFVQIDEVGANSGWLAGWNYRKNHVIANASGAGTNYQVKIVCHFGVGVDDGENVYLNGHCRADFGDVRFTGYDGVTEYDYWMEERVAGDYAGFWVEITEDLSSLNRIIYIYYGNSEATTTSNGIATFLKFDHFDDGDWSDKWTVDTGQPSEFVESGSTLKITTPQGTGRWSTLSDSPVDHGKICYMARLRRIDSDPGKCWELGQNLQDSWFNNGASVWHHIAEDYWGPPRRRLQERDAFGSKVDDSDDVIYITDTSWHIQSLYYLYDTKAMTEYDEGTKLVNIFSAPRSSNPKAMIAQSAYIASTNDTISEWDWIAVRKYVDPEPTHGSWGTPEEYDRAITIISPQNRYYATTSVPLTFIVNETTSWMGYSLDGQANVTVTGNTTLVGLLEGLHSAVVYANGTSGNMWVSGTIYFAVDTTPPTVSVLSPENTTYVSSSIPLTFTVSEPTSWMGYSLDDQANVTILGNTTLTSLTNGSHNIIIYVKDLAGNSGASNTAFFTVELPVTGLCAISVEPSKTIVAPAQAVTATVTITNIIDCAGIQLWIDYNATILEYVGYNFDTNPANPLSPTQMAPASWDRVDADVSVPGSVKLATVWKAGVPTYSGSGVAAEITFKALTPGNSTLVFDQVWTKAVDNDGDDILFAEFNDNFITVELLPCAVYIASAAAVFPGYVLFETTEVFPEWNLPVNVTVNNVGTMPLTGSVSGYYSLDNADWLSIGSSQPISLNPSTQTLLVFYWNLKATGVNKSVYYMKFNVTATCENLTSTDEFLIEIKVRLMGDSDGDDDCDVGDQRKLALTMFTHSPNQWYLEYNSYPLFTDLDGDGDVDVGDSRKQQINMFKTWLDP